MISTACRPIRRTWKRRSSPARSSRFQDRAHAARDRACRGDCRSTGMTTFIGQPISRVDGRQKVTGAARYAAEFDVRGLAHGAVVRSTVAKGRIASIETGAAEKGPGVVAVLTQRNAPRLTYRA